MEGHYADRCQQRYDHHGHTPEAQLAEALNTLYSISGNEASTWFLDTGASTHMTPGQSSLDHSTSYTGKDCVIVGNCASLPITHTGKLFHSHDFQLLDVLVVPHITKNLLSVSKFKFCEQDGDLYVLERGNSSFVSILKNKSLHTSYALWFARLGHVNYYVISFLNKK